MTKMSSLDALGDRALVHVLEVELDDEALGGTGPTDPFDSHRIREAGNLLKRVCTKQSLSGDYAVASVREGAIRIRCGFRQVADRDLIAGLAGAGAVSSGPWASCRHFVLDASRVEALTAVGIPRDNKGPGRRARQKARELAE